MKSFSPCVFLVIAWYTSLSGTHEGFLWSPWHSKWTENNRWQGGWELKWLMDTKPHHSVTASCHGAKGSNCLCVVTGPGKRQIQEMELQETQSPTSPALFCSMHIEQRSQGAKEINTMGWRGHKSLCRRSVVVRSESCYGPLSSP